MLSLSLSTETTKREEIRVGGYSCMPQVQGTQNHLPALAPKFDWSLQPGS